MNKDNFLEYFTMILFVLAVALMLAGMVLGPFGYTNTSIFFSGAACICFILGMLLMLRAWRRS